MRLGLGLGLVRLGKAIASFVRDGLKLYYPFRDNDPELLLSGATSFDGNDQYISVADDSSLDITDAITVSAWVLTTVSSDHQRIVAKQFQSDTGTGNSCFQLAISNSDKFRWAVGGVFDIASSDSIVTNTWTHMVGTYDKTTAKLYVNGQLVQSTSATAVIRTSSQELTIGTSKFDSSIQQETHGSIANVGIWNRALSASEVESIYWKGQYADLKGTELTNLVSWYNLSADANDSTGTNNGTNNGATFLTDAYSASSPFLPRIQDKASDTVANYGEVYGGNAVSFDGTNDYIDIADNDSLSFGDGSNDSAFSISAWINMDDATNFPIVMKGVYNSDAEWHLWTQGNDNLYIVLYDESVSNTFEGANTSAITAYEGKWTHITATYDGTGGTSANNGLKIYINGSSQSLTLIGSGTYVAMENLGANVEIGRTGSTYADGKINNVKIFNTALTQDQVRELYTKPELTLPTGVSSSALKLDMPMQEGSGTTILDGSPTFLDVAVNGDFSADAVGSTSVTGWSLDDFTAEVIADGYSGNAVQLTRVDSGTQSFHQDLSGITSGNEYKINVKLKAIGGSVSAGIRVTTPTNSNPSSNIVSLPADGSWQDVELLFTAQGTTARIQIQRQESDPGSIVVDDVIINQLNLGQNHGTGVGITWATGQEHGFQHPLVRSNNPMVFDGSDDRVTNSFDNSAQDATYSFWAKSSKTTANTVFGHGASNSAFHFNFSAGRPILYLAGTYFKYWNDNSAQDDNQWHHYVVVVDVSDANGSKLYIDGSEQTVSAVNNSVPADAYSQGLTIGAQQQSGGVSFNGVINEFAVWHKFLTANEVTALYNSGLPLLPTTDSGNYASSSDLVGYWRNDGVITWTDRSTNSNNGTVSGSPTSIIVPEGLNEGRDSQGYYFSDADSISSGIRFKGAEYISVQDSETLSFGNGTSDSPFSLEAWIKPNDVTNFEVFAKGIYNSTGEYVFGFEPDDKLKFYLFDESVASTAEGVLYNTALTSSEGQWMHIVGTYDGRGGTSANAGMKIYLNGSQVNNATESAGTYVAMENLSADLEIGKYSSNYAKGSIDEAKIYSKELSASEVLKNYNNGKSAHSN